MFTRTARSSALAVFAAATLMLAAACTGANQETPNAAPGFASCKDKPNTCNSGEVAQGGQITWIVNATFDGWNLSQPEGGSVYGLQALAGIFPETGWYMPDGNWQWNMDLLAEEPKMTSEGQQSWTYKIRNEAVWNDGTPITADDFIYRWKMAASDGPHCKGCRSRASTRSDQIEKVVGTDNGKTATVTLKAGEANAEWFAQFTAQGLHPAHVVKAAGFDINTPEGMGKSAEWFNTNRPTWSGGPLLIESGDQDNQIIKVPNPKWYGKTKPTLDKIIIRFLTDEGTWISALANGEVHGSSPASFNSDVIRQAQGMDNVHVGMGPGPSWEHLDVNMDNTWLKDVALRKAIFTAVNRQDIAKRTFGELYPDVSLRNHHVFGSKSKYFKDIITPTGQGTGDIAKAKSILTAAGYVIEGGTLKKDGQTVGPFRLRATATSIRTTTMQLIQSYLKEIGVQVNIEPTSTLGATLTKQDFDLMMYGWSGSPLFSQNANQYWNSTSGSNYGKYKNPQVDDLAKKAASAKTLDEAAKLANEAAEIVVDGAYVLPLVETPVFIMVTNDYRNVRDNSNASLRGLYNHEQWGKAAAAAE